ncbi:MAG: anthranilate phosphoribosyltransferase [Candidatus Promineifilaceae bacterium]
MSHFSAEFIPYIKAVGRGEKLKRDLSYNEARNALRLILQGKPSLAQTGAFLIAQRVKGESVDEVRAFTDVVREEFTTPVKPSVNHLLDLATPYDGKAKTAQLAPAVALTLAAAGVPVLLHGAANVPTKCGVTVGMVLQALGLRTNGTVAQAAADVDRVGVGYIDASQFAPAWDALIPLRHHFGLRTVFNTVEKFFNPANAPYQISGFFHANYVDRIRAQQTGARLSYIVQGEEGSVEMAAGRRSRIFAISAENDLTLDPSAVGLPQREKIQLPPTLSKHTQLNATILAGNPSPATDQVAFTVGTILFLLKHTATITSGYETAQTLLSSGKVQQTLNSAQAI